MSTSDQPNPYQAPTSVEQQLVQPELLLDGRLRTTAIGLKLIYVGILLMLLGWIGGILAPILGLDVFVFASLLGAGSVLGVLLISIGPILCLSVPSESGLRVFAIMTVVTQALAAAGIIGAALPIRSTAVPIVARIAALSILVLIPVAMSLFLLFLYRLAKTIGRDDLARRVRNVCILGGLTFFLLAPALAFVSNSQGLAISFFGLMSLLLLIVLVAYANVINALSEAIRRPDLKKTPAGIA